MSHFVFPNLTTFKLLPIPTEDLTASCLLDFLRASPLLQTVEMSVFAEIDLTSVPHNMVVVLPNVETFSLHVAEDILPQIYDFASHISCPCARSTSLTHDTYNNAMRANLEVFPMPTVWNTIVHQYMASPVAEVTLKTKRSEGVVVACFLTFQSSDAVVLRLGFSIRESGVGENELNMSDVEMGWDIFSQALTTIRDHPLLSHVRRLRIKERVPVSSACEVRTATKIQELLSSLGPLDELTIRGCDLRLLLAGFLDDPGLCRLGQPISFPQIKDFKILYPSMGIDEMECMNAIVELAKSQHALGIPFECVTVRTWYCHEGMEEELGRWVATVDYSLWCKEGEDV